MSQSFKKIKKRYFIEAVIISAVCAVSFGLLASGAVLLGLKLAEKAINAGWYVLIAFGAFALSGTAVFFILRPTDKKLAKKLDNEHGLNERVQTMVAYVGQDGAMLEMQRADAEEKLGALPKRKVTFKTIWQYVVITALSLAVFLTAVCLPFKAPGGEVFVPISKTERDMLLQLKDDVNSSKLEDGLKASYVLVLDNLLETLEGDVTESRRRSAVLSAVALTDSFTEASNSYKKICAQLIAVETLKTVSDATVNAITLYRASGIAVKSYEEVKKRSENLIENIHDNYVSSLTSGENSLRSVFAVSSADGLIETLQKYSADIGGCVFKADAGDEDALAVALDGFAEALEETAGYQSPNNNDESYQRGIDSAFTAYCAGAAEALSVQSYNWIMDEFVRERLADIFKISDLPQIKYGVEGGSQGYNPGDGDNEDTGNEGGMGSGHEKFGTDVIFVPEKGYVQLKDVFDEYNSKMLNMLLDGSLTDEAAEIVHLYFRLLQERTGEEE